MEKARAPALVKAFFCSCGQRRVLREEQAGRRACGFFLRLFFLATIAGKEEQIFLEHIPAVKSPACVCHHYRQSVLGLAEKQLCVRTRCFVHKPENKMLMAPKAVVFTGVLKGTVVQKSPLVHLRRLGPVSVQEGRWPRRPFCSHHPSQWCVTVSQPMPRQWIQPPVGEFPFPLLPEEQPPCRPPELLFPRRWGLHVSTAAPAALALPS